METSGNPLQAANDDLVLIAFSALKGHGRQIVRWTATATGLAVLIGGAYFWTQHVERRSSAVVRLTFAGADKGAYPNGLPFAPADLVGTTGLDAVYDRHDVARVCGREDFRRAFSVEPVPPQPGTAYRLSLVPPQACAGLPDAVASKVLTEVLTAWAADAESKQAALELAVPLISSSVFDASADNARGLYVKAALLRSALASAIENVTRLRGLPGADVFRSGAKGERFLDVEATLRELAGVRYDAVMASAESAHGPEITRWIAEQLEDQERILRGKQALSQIYLTALRAFSGASTGAGEPGSAGGRGVPDRIVELSDKGAEYRQSLTEIYIRNQIAGMEAQQRVDHLRKLATAGHTSGRASGQEIVADLDQIVADARKALDQLGAIYEDFARATLRPSPTMYQVEQGPQTVTVKALSARQLVILVGAALLGSLAIGMLAAILYDQFLMTPPVAR